MSMRLERPAASMMPSKPVSLAKRGSPPGASDCSGSQYFALPLKAIVLMPASRSAPPIASTARFTRFCSRVGVAQETTRAALQSATSACFMGPPGWFDQPRRTSARRQLFRLRRAGAAGGGRFATPGFRLGNADQAEFGAAYAAVAVAVDG